MISRLRSYTNTAALSGIVSTGGLSGWASLIPQSGLIAAWPFDTHYSSTSVIQDPIGGFNATCTNVTLLGSGPSGSPNLNNAGVFNGSSAFAQTTFGNLPSTACSIVMWTYTPSNGGQPRVFTNDHTDADNNGFQLYWDGGNALGLQLGNATGTQIINGFPINAVTSWINFVYTFSGVTLTSYVNGTSQTSTTFVGPISNGSTTAAFGYSPAFGSAFYNGYIAGTAIYNRALASSEVATIYSL